MLKRTAAFVAIVTVACIVAIVPSMAIAQGASPGAPEKVSLIIKMAPGLSDHDKAAVVTRNGGTQGKSIPALKLIVIEVPAQAADKIKAKYGSDPQVQRVEDNKTRHAGQLREPTAVPTDPLFSSQWSLPIIWWDLPFGTIPAAGTAKVAILDTGIDATHEDLTANVLPGTSILDGTDGRTDPNGHGTTLAGIVAAQTNTTPGAGIAGVGYAGVQLLPVTVLDSTGQGQDADVIAGLLWAADNGADVILMGFSNTGFSQSLQDAIDYAWGKGVVLVAAVGNDAASMPTFPAGDRGVMGVSATDNSDLIASFSNEGQAVFIAAPGVDIQTTLAGGGYGLTSGTSASAAIVAGAAAMLKAADPTLTNGVIVGRLARTTDPAGDQTDPMLAQTQVGNGRVNLAHAMVDTGTDPIQPAGADPVGSGGPFVGPYVAAANRALGITSLAITTPAGATDGTMNVSQAFTVHLVYTKTGGTWTNVTATLTVPPGWTKSADLSVASLTTSPNTYDWTVTPSATPSSGSISVSLNGTPPSGDTCNSTCPSTSSFAVTSVNAAALSVTAVTACQSGTLPCDNTGDTVIKATQSVDVKVTVQNTGGAAATGVLPGTLSVTASGVSGASTCSVVSPSPPTAIAGGASATFTYTCGPVSGNGSVTFSNGTASGTDQNSLLVVSSVSGNQTSNSITVDSTAPTSTITFPTGGSSYNAASWNSGCSSAICGTATDGGSGVAAVNVSIQRNSTTKCWSGSNFTASCPNFVPVTTGTTNWSLAFPASNFPADGSYTVQSQVTDNAGNIETAGSGVTFTVDTTPPSLVITGPFVSGTSTPLTATNTGPVDYTITYSDADTITLSSGNVTLNKTLTANASSINVAGSGSTRTVTLSTITGNGTIGITIAAGTASDTAGNTAAGAGPSTTFTVDNDPPTLSIGSPSVAATNVGPVNFQIDYTGATSVTLGTGDISVTPTGTASGTVTVSGGGVNTRTVKFQPTSGDGTLKFSIAAGTATDTAGNAAAGAGPSATFVVDNTLPQSAVTFPAAGGNYTSATFNAGCAGGGLCGTASDPTAGGVSSGLLRVQISIKRNSDSAYWNAGAWGPAAGAEVFNNATGTTNWTYAFSAPADGTYVVRSRATDNAGNIEVPGTGNTFTISSDNVPPVSVITFPAGGGVYNPTSYNAGCAAPGLCGTASDNVGGSGVQKVEVSIKRNSDGFYWNGSSFVTGSEVYNLATGTGTWSYGFAVPADGSYTVHARATDNNSNGESLVQTATFTVDNATPSSAITFPTAATYSAAAWNAGCSSRICGTANDPGTSASGVAKVEVAIRQSGGNYWTGSTFGSPAPNWVQASGMTSWTLAFPAANMADGTYLVQSRATDNAGNVETPGSGVTFTIDTNPPAVTVSITTNGGVPNGANGWFTTASVAGSITATDASGVSAISCIGATASNFIVVNATTSTATFSVSAPGSTIVTCTATDGNGNTGAASGSSYTAVIKLDSILPTASITTPPVTPKAQYFITQTVASNFTCSDGSSPPASGIATCVGDANVNTSTLGTNLAFTVVATDIAGNIGGATNYYDVIALPTTTTLGGPFSVQYSDGVTLTATVADNSSCGTCAPGSLTGTVQFYIKVGASWQAAGSPQAVSGGTATLTDLVVGLPAASYDVKAVFTSSNANFAGSEATGSLALGVIAEGATVTFDSNNPGAVPVVVNTTLSGSFTLKVYVKETNPDAGAYPHAGDISKLGLTVTLNGISTGGNPSVTCVSTYVPDATLAYADVNSFNCTFTGVPIDAYEIDALVTGVASGNYYAGSGADVLTVYDPSAGFVTGGGKFLMPVDANNSDLVNFGLVYNFTGKNKANARGNLLVIRHIKSGPKAGDVCRAKSNGIGAAAVLNNTASFSGTGNYICQRPDGSTYDGVGNQSILGWVQDNGQGSTATGPDMFWINVSAPNSVLVMSSTPSANALPLTGGNIQVPQPAKK